MDISNSWDDFLEMESDAIEKIVADMGGDMERYNKSVCFNTAVHNVLTGHDPLRIIGDLCAIIDTQQKTINKFAAIHKPMIVEYGRL